MSKQRNTPTKTPTQRAVTISAQGEVIHIKCKQTGRVILKLKAIPNKQYKGDYDLLIAMCDEGTAYAWDAPAVEQIAEYEAMGGKS